MKKLVIAASILAASTASAFTADLAARPYTKAPPIVAALYDWSGFYIGINGGGVWSHKCWDNNNFLGVVTTPRFLKVAMTQRAARSVVKSAIAGRPPPGCLAWKRRATGLT